MPRIETIQAGARNLKIHIYPARTAGDFSYPVVLFFIWILGVYIIGKEFGDAADTGMVAFLSVLVLVWLTCGAFLGYVFLWKLKGREVVKTAPGGLLVGRELPGWHSYSLIPYEDIQQLSVAGINEKATSQSMSANYFGIMGGSVTLHSQDGAYQFGIQLSRKEAEQVIGAINACLNRSQ